MPVTPLEPRKRRAELRAAVLRAHPDHGGSRQELEVALAQLRAVTAGRVGTSEPLRPSPSRRRPTTVRRELWGIGKVIFGVYFVAVPVMLAFGLALAAVQDWLF